MIKVGNAWSWLVARIKGSESSLKTGPPYRDIPPIPEPKVRSKSRYSIVIINEAGNSRQLELTPARLRVGAVALVGVVAVLVVLAGFGAKSLFSGSRTAAKQDDALAEKLRSVQEELNKKELALAVQEKRLKEMQETPTLATIPSRLSGESPSSGGPDAGKGLASAGKGPLTALQEPEDSESQASARTPGDEEEFEDLAKPAPAEPKSGQSKALSSTEPTPAKPAADSAKSPPVNFDAQAVTAASEGPNTGTLSFKLTKDQPDLRFSGFLFVFVEMTDPRGENKIYAYPKRTRLGDGDLPSNYKDGESLSFKYNSRVELPYSDIRSGAHLERVSILLYGENGKIVFQRGFDRREVKLLGAKGSAMDGTRHRAGDKRRAL